MRHAFGWQAICLLCLVLLVSACGDDGEPTDGDQPDGDAPVDGDSDGDSDGDLPDGDVDGDEPDGDTPDGDDPWDAVTLRGDVLIPRGAGVVLTPSAVSEDGNPGDGSWQLVGNYLAGERKSNFAYTSEGIVLGYGDLSRHVYIAENGVELPADNGALISLQQGPFAESTTIPVEADTYYYLYIADGDKTYYLRLYYEYKSGDGLHGTYAFSESPKFP